MEISDQHFDDLMKKRDLVVSDFTVCFPYNIHQIELL